MEKSFERAIKRAKTDISYFDRLPPEIIQEICKKADISTLRNFVKTSKRHKEICKKLLDKKLAKLPKKVYLEKNEKYFYINTIHALPRSIKDKRKKIIPILCGYHTMGQYIYVSTLSDLDMESAEKLAIKIGDKLQKNLFFFRRNSSNATLIITIYDFYQSKIIHGNTKINIPNDQCDVNTSTNTYEIPITTIYKDKETLETIIKNLFNNGFIMIITGLQQQILGFKSY